jgi:hypothetical protein
VDARGLLPAKPEGLAHADPAQVRAEVRAQVALFERLAGRPPTHLDSHHHAHRRPIVFEALAELARERGLPVRGASPDMIAALRAAGVCTPDAFIDDFFGAGARLERLLDILRGLPPGVSELMCHPARVDDELRAGSSYAEEREVELALLTGAEAREALRAAGVELLHFGALGQV